MQQRDHGHNHCKSQEPKCRAYALERDGDDRRQKNTNGFYANHIFKNTDQQRTQWQQKNYFQ